MYLFSAKIYLRIFEVTIFRLSLDKIHNNQDITQLIFAGGLGGCLGKTILEEWFSDYFKLPAVAGLGVRQ